MAVYSTRFGIGAVAVGTPVNIYTVPAGHTAVVRNIDVTPSSAPSGIFFLGVVGIGFFLALQAGIVNNSVHWEGRAVFNSGEGMEIDSFVSNFNYAISGYLLS